MVYFSLSKEYPLNATQTAAKLKELGVLVDISGERRFRLVTHLSIDDQDVKTVVQAFKEVMS